MTKTLSNTFPPGPSIPSPIQTALFFLRPFPFVHACQQRYGDIFRLRLIEGFGHTGDIVYIADIDAIRDVFAADGTAAHAGKANAVLEPVTGAQSILTLDREEHLSERKLISPALHGGALATAQRDIADIAAEEEATWPSDRPFALRPAMQRITFRVIARLVFGSEDPQTMTRLPELLEPVFNNVLALLPQLRYDLGPLSPWGRFRRGRDRLDRELLRIIAERRAKPPGTDMLSLLVFGTDPEQPRSDEQARDELLTLLLAGHETSATALSWAFERLARHPEALVLARRAAIEGDERYLNAVVHETLRVRPVVMDVARILDQPLSIGGYDIPTGTTVMPAIYLVQTDERHHPEAQTFRPERFLDTRPDVTTWLPFGGGRRRCVGAAFALLEIRTILQVVLARRSLRAPNSDAEQPVLRGVTFVPKRDAFMELPQAQPNPSDQETAQDAMASRPGVSV
jgi:cytochrome P450